MLGWAWQNHISSRLDYNRKLQISGKLVCVVLVLIRNYLSLKMSNNFFPTKQSRFSEFSLKMLCLNFKIQHSFMINQQKLIPSQKMFEQSAVHPELGSNIG